MTVRVGINGFGRIGRNFLRAILATGADVEVVGVNDLTSPETLAHLLRYDSTNGRLPVPVDVEGDDLLVGEQRIRVMAEREPEQLPWDKLGATVVIESTGRFTSRSDAAGHLGGSVKHVIISGPSGDADATFVIGVNDERLRSGEAHRRLQRLVHDELLRPHGQGARRSLRDRERADDDGARVHQRPEPARPHPQGPPPGPGCRGQHRADHDRRGQGDQPGAGGDEGPSRRHVAARAPAGRVHHRLHGGGAGQPVRRRRQRRVRGGGGQAAAGPGAGVHRGPDRLERHRRLARLVHVRRGSHHGHADQRRPLPGQGPTGGTTTSGATRTGCSTSPCW